MTVKFRSGSTLAEAPRDEVRSLFVSSVNSYTRIGDERFGFESRVNHVDFSRTASGDPWKNPIVMQVGPSDGSRLLARRMAVLAVARSVFAVEDVARPTVSQTGPMRMAEYAFRLC